MAWLGRWPYEEALSTMRCLRSRILSGQANPTLLLCEHEPVITLGRHANAGNLLLPREQLADKGVRVVQIERGGDVTYHGPGQLMIYPIARVGKGARPFLRAIALELEDFSRDVGVRARWRDDEPGLWVGEHKVAACGIHVHRGISIHGFALNLFTPASAWQAINPCGFSASTPRSLVELGASGVADVGEVAQRLEGPIRRRLAKFLASN